MRVFNDAEILEALLFELAKLRGVTVIPAVSDEMMRAKSIALKHAQKGNAHIRKILVDKGIDDDSIINNAIESLPAEEIRAVRPAQKKLNRVKGKSRQDKIAKTAVYLSSIGFASHLCWTVANQEMLQLEQSQEDIDEF